MALGDNITTGYKDEQMKYKAHVSIISTIDFKPTYIFKETNNTNDEMCDVILAETMLKLMYAQKIG